MVIPVKTSVGGYDIVLQRGALNEINKYIDLSKKVLIVTDDGVPCKYAQTVASFCKEPYIQTIQQGEISKNIENFSLLLSKLVEHKFTRSDCIVAVGGGVVGDLAGFVASTYMRGIGFYNIPTTLLSQVDSSIGGKTAIDFMGIKNIVGAFYPPKRVVIDPDTLSTLPQRHIANGMAEALKMALTHDKDLFALFENGDPIKCIDKVIESSLLIKKAVVEADEHEVGSRRVLNFGHTLAHGIESANEMENLYHGECVAIGMTYMCGDGLKQRLIPVLKKLGLPYSASPEMIESALRVCSVDKKMSGDTITIVYVEDVERFELRKMPFYDFETMIRGEL